MPNLLHETPGLIAFVRTVETGSFSAAAKILKTSPSAVSKGVGRLEALVSARLFLRSTRALTLTSEGQKLFEKVAPILRQLDTSDEIASGEDAWGGRIRFSMPSELARFFTTPIFRDFAPLFPALKLEVSLTDRKVDLIKEDYDVVFRVGGSSQGNLKVRKLADVEMVVVASPSYVEKHGKPRSVEEASRLPFARYAVNGNPRPIVFLGGEQFVPEGRVDCDTGQALRAAAIHGLGAALLMRCVVQDELNDGRLVNISPQLRLPTEPLSVIHAFDSMMPGRVRRFCDFIAELTKTIPGL
ncbi:LysR family transcriptional regulator [Rhizobium sp. CECT 9324]|uniref:LysR family transcriptional regulator n=1 Tax=Rhizobium sp. CECT 9324 TaxID=2845820 RepID=UPI001E4EA9F0|nr:LysR family transcriptional regulator [Rhizobium sp. CECT 9324]CAH0340881.1 HTH-type transcriptional regulator DmlR [Rhizobium sp. CECT 9324]